MILQYPFPATNGPSKSFTHNCTRNKLNFILLNPRSCFGVFRDLLVAEHDFGRGRHPVFQGDGAIMAGVDNDTARHFLVVVRAI